MQKTSKNKSSNQFLKYCILALIIFSTTFSNGQPKSKKVAKSKKTCCTVNIPNRFKAPTKKENQKAAVFATF